MTPHTKRTWRYGGDACTECAEDWPCRDMRIWQAGYRAGLKEVTVELERLRDMPDELRDRTMDIYDLKRWLDAKLKEQP